MVKKLCVNLGETWCGRSVTPAVCDCADPFHQFLRSQHTTITTNHNYKKILPRNKTPVCPTKHLSKTPCPHLPTRQEGLITRWTARRPREDTRQTAAAKSKHRLNLTNYLLAERGKAQSHHRRSLNHSMIQNSKHYGRRTRFCIEGYLLSGPRLETPVHRASQLATQVQSKVGERHIQIHHRNYIADGRTVHPPSAANE